MAKEPTSNESLSVLINEWNRSSKQFDALEAQHRHYTTKLTELNKMQAECLKNVSKQRRALEELKAKVKRYDVSTLADEDSARYHDLVTEIGEQKMRLVDMSDQLPRQNNGLYLNIILGNINVSLLNKADRFLYKDEYEKFKLTVTVVTIIAAFASYVLHFRVLDALFHFLLVWYYCTLTIRENILRVNGSRIKGWWVFHHYASAVLCGTCLTWPDGQCYQAFRGQFIMFTFYVGVVQLLQCQYQRGCLYRLRTLGMRHSMDITVEGFHTWMFRGLTFLLPFLILGYLLQLYNAYVLVKIFRTYSCREWQVLLVAALFFIVAVGNTVTTAQACLAKFRETSSAGHRHRLTTKYQVDTQADDEEDEHEKKKE